MRTRKVPKNDGFQLYANLFGQAYNINKEIEMFKILTGLLVGIAIQLIGCISNENKVPEYQMVLVPSGCYDKGDAGKVDSKTESVCVAQFHLGKYLVTQYQFSESNSNPSKFNNCGGSCPVEQVDWLSAAKFCDEIGARLPTDDEWEYAARGGTSSVFYWGNDTSFAAVGRYAWYRGNSGPGDSPLYNISIDSGSTRPVGQKLPNAYGLYDMEGNLMEWTSTDVDDTTIYTWKTVKDNSMILIRSGSWESYVGGLKVTSKVYHQSIERDDRVGFRCAK